MKSIIITLTLLCSFSFFSQAEKTNQADTIKNVHLQEKREKGEVWKTQVLSNPLHSRVYQRSQNPRFRGHWSGFNLGFADFSVSNEQLDGAGDYLDLERKNSLVMQFNMFQYSMRLNKLNNIGLVTGLGLEYQRFRFALSYPVQYRVDRIEPLVGLPRFLKLESSLRIRLLRFLSKFHYYSLLPVTWIPGC